jgi:hypothetical protein
LPHQYHGHTRSGPRRGALAVERDFAADHAGAG